MLHWHDKIESVVFFNCLSHNSIEKNQHLVWIFLKNNSIKMYLSFLHQSFAILPENNNIYLYLIFPINISSVRKKNEFLKNILQLQKFLCDNSIWSFRIKTIKKKYVYYYETYLSSKSAFTVSSQLLFKNVRTLSLLTKATNFAKSVKFSWGYYLCGIHWCSGSLW